MCIYWHYLVFIYFYKLLLSSSSGILENFHRNEKENRMFLLSVLLHGSRRQYMMKLINGTDKTKGLFPSHSCTIPMEKINLV